MITFKFGCPCHNVTSGNPVVVYDFDQLKNCPFFSFTLVSTYNPVNSCNVSVHTHAVYGPRMYVDLIEDIKNEQWTIL